MVQSEHHCYSLSLKVQSVDFQLALADVDQDDKDPIDE